MQVRPRNERSGSTNVERNPVERSFCGTSCLKMVGNSYPLARATAWLCNAIDDQGSLEFRLRVDRIMMRVQLRTK
jgi:hypothetical protein